jgi:Uma2 family endonuclease
MVNQPATEKIRWTTADLELLPEGDLRYEIVDGDLLVTRAPHWKHQKAINRIANALDTWSSETNLGESVPTPGLIFSDVDNVIPDAVWISKERLATGLDEAGHLIVAPELIIEVLSSGVENTRRDKDLKLRLYSARGVREYWIIDWQEQRIELYRREKAMLSLAVTLLPGDNVTSPLLPGFIYSVVKLFE